MIDAAIKALQQMFSPRFRAVLIKSVSLALVLIVLIGIGIHRILVWLAANGGMLAEGALGPDAHGPLSVLLGLLSITAGLGIFVGAVFLCRR